MKRSKYIAIGFLLGFSLFLIMGFTFSPGVGSAGSVDVRTFTMEIDGHEYAVVITTTKQPQGYISSSAAMTHHAGCHACVR